jgi:hypothetical protein
VVAALVRVNVPLYLVENRPGGLDTTPIWVDRRDRGCSLRGPKRSEPGGSNSELAKSNCVKTQTEGRSALVDI